jgi:hypothetical protein
VDVRKILTWVEETRWDGGRAILPPSRKAVAAAVFANPYARGADDGTLGVLAEAGRALGALLVERALAALAVPAEEVTGYGKGAVVGTAGELEHAAAVLHPRFGASVRAVVGPGKAIIASAKKSGPPGAALLVPLGGKEDAWSIDDFDAAEISVPDSPHEDEILVALALAVGGRPGHRITFG